MKVLHIDDVKGEKLGENVLRKILVHSENLMLMYTEAMPGGPSISHSHPHEQITLSRDSIIGRSWIRWVHY